MYEKILERFASAGITPNILAESTDVPMMQQQARDDLAIALVPQLSQSQTEEGGMSIPVPELDAVAEALNRVHGQFGETAANAKSRACQRIRS